MKYEAEKGMSIYGASLAAVDMAAKYGVEVELIFNGLTMFVSPFSHAADIATIYNLKSEIRRLNS